LRRNKNEYKQLVMKIYVVRKAKQTVDQPMYFDAEQAGLEAEKRNDEEGKGEWFTSVMLVPDPQNISRIVPA
jgi:hypothetical protein